jgi:DNA-binding SARP family transcriptional activator
VRIHLLGQMRASSYRHTDVLPRGRKARAVLACLCLAKGAFVSRARLAAMLWDRVPDFQARASFRQAFRELTVAFGSLANDLLLADRDTVRLDTAVCWIDAVALLSEETGADKETRSKLAELCKGELLEDLNHVSNAFDQWLLNERSGFSESLRNLLEGKLEQAEAGTQPSEREELAHPDARARRPSGAGAGAGRIQALPRGVAAGIRCRAFAGDACTL